ncbi:ligase-associated DNA damage response endonuclease PdeM [Pedobacter psychroterrae]|uniref:Ligase-associated DNA damage response endonuclease PdeM n=1 Tax=Pedobacter psychroterrae TaxID=2530453 RepID=A0A4R0NLD6_9SPHI|nr:ligase-associated DNA damage response endonuclease PdeM [Pedobacter psychroterrae]TCD01632.1 ligase-associated DNA damage response endonuclease PdeM [Pedobacter psychroterrae]
MTINCREEALILSKEKAIYWAAKRMLIISDLHIGKSAHFRKHGLQVPDAVGHTDLRRLSRLMAEFDAETLLVTGDMFHNKINSDANAFLEWRKSYPELRIVLIKGNHDALKNEDYEALDIEVYQKELLCAPFRFIHDKPKEFDEYYNISGHIHPGVVLYGRARQQLKFPCFYFSDTCAVLPAFSVFTGLFMIKREVGDSFYAVTPEKVVKV